MRTIHQVAKLAGVSVRTLHYYDAMGLLPPSSATEAGYRLYDDAALCRLREILFLRELEFPLKEIQPMLELEACQQGEAIQRHRELLLLKRDRLQGLIDLCDQLLKGEITMGLESFDTTALENARQAYAEEAKQRWGQTEAYRQSEQRTAGYGKQDWAAAQADASAILRDAAAVGTSPASETAQAIARRWQAHITRYYYDCTDEILAGLAELYETDERFQKYLDGFGTGTAAFLSASIRGLFAR